MPDEQGNPDIFIDALAAAIKQLDDEPKPSSLTFRAKYIERFNQLLDDAYRERGSHSLLIPSVVSSAALHKQLCQADDFEHTIWAVADELWPEEDDE